MVHLVTAADGAAEFYSTANNAARHEDADEARVVDQRIRQVWLGSPNFVVIHNPRSSRRKSIVEGGAHGAALATEPALTAPTGAQQFQAKLRRAVAAVCRACNVAREEGGSKRFWLSGVTMGQAWKRALEVPAELSAAGASEDALQRLCASLGC